MAKQLLVLRERVSQSIVTVRGQNVLFDTDLAALYGVPTKALNQAVRRNRDRFPADFMFQVTAGEASILRSQFVTSRSHGGRRSRPYAFTEQGVAMLSSVLKSERAVSVNIAIMRAFIAARRAAASHADLRDRLTALEQKYDDQFAGVFRAIRRLMASPARRRRPIGFAPRPATPIAMARIGASGKAAQ